MVKKKNVQVGSTLRIKETAHLCTNDNTGDIVEVTEKLSFGCHVRNIKTGKISTYFYKELRKVRFDEFF